MGQYILGLSNLFLNHLNHHSGFLLESELLLKKDLPTRRRFAILVYLKLRKATEREASSLLHIVSIESTKVLLDSVTAFK